MGLAFKNLLFFLCLFYLGFVALLYTQQRSFLYHPNPNMPDISKAPWAQEMSVQTSDGLTLNAWWRAPTDGDKPLVVFFHGNAGHIEHRVQDAQEYLDQGYGVVLAEYRGYGGNGGMPSEEGLYEDGRAYMDWVIKQADIPLSNVILHGESLGSGIATQMASEHEVAALILEVPFYSVLDMARYRYPFIPFMHYLVKDPYRNDLKINALTMPVLIGVAGQDDIVPERFGVQLFEQAKAPKMLKRYPDAGHAELGMHGFFEDAIAFIDGL